MSRNYATVEWDEQTEADCRALVTLALREDLGERGDITTAAVVGADSRGRAAIVAREAGVVAGLTCVDVVLTEARADAAFTPALGDGDRVEPGASLGVVEGAGRDLLTCERTILNLLGRLCGVATLTRAYADAVAGTGAEVFDTRKTTPGWRRLEKYAVRCGGGRNHRVGLHDAVLIKDNHLALAGASGKTIADAVDQARRTAGDVVVEVEVDTLEQLREVLPAGPDVVLLDNMPPDVLREAVATRDANRPDVALEASGGLRLDTIRGIAETGVERISVGALTHQATSLDVGLDWR